MSEDFPKLLLNDCCGSFLPKTNKLALSEESPGVFLNDDAALVSERRHENFATQEASEKPLYLNCSHLLPVAPFKPLLESQIHLDAGNFKLGAFLRLGGQTLGLVELFDLLDRLINADPSILQLVFFVETLWVQILGCLLRIENGLFSESAHLPRPCIGWVRCQDSVLYVVHEVKAAVVEHSR